METAWLRRKEPCIHTPYPSMTSLVLLCTLLLHLSVGPVYNQRLCASTFDLIFVVDSSGSIRDNNPRDGSYDNWNIMVQFMANFVKKFVVGSGNQNMIRVAAVDYGNDASVQFTFQTDPVVLNTKILGLQYRVVRETTNTGDGIYKMMNELVHNTTAGDRPDVRDVAVIITDGKSTNSSIALQYATEAKNKNVEIFTIGVTSSANETEIKLLSSQPQIMNVTYWMIPNVQSLPAAVDGITSKLCQILADPLTTPGTTTSTTITASTTTTRAPTTTTTTTTTLPQQVVSTPIFGTATAAQSTSSDNSLLIAGIVISVLFFLALLALLLLCCCRRRLSAWCGACCAKKEGKVTAAVQCDIPVPAPPEPKPKVIVKDVCHKCKMNIKQCICPPEHKCTHVHCIKYHYHYHPILHHHPQIHHCHHHHVPNQHCSTCHHFLHHVDLDISPPPSDISPVVPPQSTIKIYQKPASKPRKNSKRIERNRGPFNHWVLEHSNLNY